MQTKILKINAFGETREMECTFVDSQPGRYWVIQPVFAARFRTGKKLHKVTVSLFDQAHLRDGIYYIKAQAVTTLNRLCFSVWLVERRI